MKSRPRQDRPTDCSSISDRGTMVRDNDNHQMSARVFGCWVCYSLVEGELPASVALDKSSAQSSKPRNSRRRLNDRHDACAAEEPVQFPHETGHRVKQAIAQTILGDPKASRVTSDRLKQAIAGGAILHRTRRLAREAAAPHDGPRECGLKLTSAMPKMLSLKPCARADDFFTRHMLEAILDFHVIA